MEPTELARASSEQSVFSHVSCCGNGGGDSELAVSGRWPQERTRLNASELAGDRPREEVPAVKVCVDPKDASNSSSKSMSAQRVEDANQRFAMGSSVRSDSSDTGRACNNRSGERPALLQGSDKVLSLQEFQRLVAS